MPMKAIDLHKEFPTISQADFNFLLCNLKHCNPGQVSLNQSLNSAEVTTMQEWLGRLLGGEPPQYVVHTAWFFSMELYVDPRVLIPRYDTEVLVDALLPYLVPKAKVLEIGVGSGAISLALKKSRADLQIFATDIDGGALDVARKNSIRLQLPIYLVQADLFPASEGDFDLIVSNPPYISPEEYLELESTVRDKEPKIALLAADKGFAFFKRILDKAPQYLKAGGILAFEHGNKQQSALQNLTESAGFRLLQKGRDLAGRDRFLIVKLK